MRSRITIAAIALDGSSPVGFNCLTRFGRRKLIPLRFEKEVVGSLNYYRHVDGHALMADISWLYGAGKYSDILDAWHRGHQLYLNTWFVSRFEVKNNEAIKYIDITAGVLEQVSAGSTPGVFSWP